MCDTLVEYVDDPNIQKLYLCDGFACDDKEDTSICYINGGDCIHTPNPEHSIKKKLGDKFPKTTFCKLPTYLAIERIRSKELMQYLVDDVEDK